MAINSASGAYFFTLSAAGTPAISGISPNTLYFTCSIPSSTTFTFSASPLCAALVTLMHGAALRALISHMVNRHRPIRVLVSELLRTLARRHCCRLAELVDAHAHKVYPYLATLVADECASEMARAKLLVRISSSHC